MKYLRRFIWYIATRLTILCLVFSIVIVLFYYAMNVFNMQVVVKDGMAKRAYYVMTGKDGTDLNKYFAHSFLDRDELVLSVKNGTSPYKEYKDYGIVGIDHRVSLSWMWCWPWENRSRVDFIEEIPKIDSRSKSYQTTTAKGAERSYPPSWQNAKSVKHRAILVRENGKWLIQALQTLEIHP